MLEFLLDVARSLGASVDPLVVEGESGEALEALRITFAGATILAIARPAFGEVACGFQLSLRARARLAGIPPATRRRVAASIQREAGGGRTRVDVRFMLGQADEGLADVVLQQPLFALDGTHWAVQRAADALVEVAGAAARTRGTLDGLDGWLSPSRG